MIIKAGHHSFQNMKTNMRRVYSKTCVREPPSRLTLNSGWCGKSCLSYKGTCHVILLAKLHDMYLYTTTTFPHQPLKSVSKVAVLHRFYCIKNQWKCKFYYLLMGLKFAGWVVNSADPDRTLHCAASGQALHCFLGAVCPIIYDKCGKFCIVSARVH